LIKLVEIQLNKRSSWLESVSENVQTKKLENEWRSYISRNTYIQKTCVEPKINPQPIQKRETRTANILSPFL